MQKEKSPRNPKEASGKADQESIGEKGFDRDLKDNANESYIKKILEKDLENFLDEAPDEDKELAGLLDRIHHRIRLNESMKRERPVRRILKVYTRAAAILFIPLFIAGGIYLFHKANETESALSQEVTSTIYAPPGSRIAFVLPDSTKGMLNGGSHISYTLPFSENRRIRLEGEAWLDVARDEEHPFVVEAANSTIRVLGTSFNLNAYSDDDFVEVVLLEGKVEFRPDESDPPIIMNPSEKLSYRNGCASKLKVDAAKYSAWTEGKLVFRGDLMTEVAQRIEKWYNVEIVLADRELENYSFRGTFQDDSLEEVIKCLALTSPIGYDIIPGALMADGTFRKKEVRLYRISK